MSTQTQEIFIEKQLAAMTLEEKIGQVLHPYVLPQHNLEDIRKKFSKIKPGGVFVMPGNRDEIAPCIETVQACSSTPVVISCDLENGPGRMIKDATIFPDLMALAATRSTDLAREMARSAALEGLELGIHWTFGPIVDINANPQNPITNTRGLGDDPELISQLALTLIDEMQRNGLAATAKHFPGDGYDCRDQHVCTTINPLSREDWDRLSGEMFRRAINAGVWSIMIGHIALPSVYPGKGRTLADAPPATLSHRLTTELLRGGLGFDGMIVSDASFMGGVTSRGPREEIVPAMLMAGCDQILFCNLELDFQILLKAVQNGKVTEERLEDAVRRVLRLKQQLGLFERVRGEALTADTRAGFAQSSRKVAEAAITLVRDRLGALPLALGAGKRVLSYHLRADTTYNVDGMDDLLRATGAEVVRCTEEDVYKLPPDEEMQKFDAIILHWIYGPSWKTNRIRPNGNFLRDVILRLSMHDKRMVFVSYGTPYLLHDMPEIPALVNAYSPDAETQRAVLKLLTGELKPVGTSPVRLELEADWFPANCR